MASRKTRVDPTRTRREKREEEPPKASGKLEPYVDVFRRHHGRDPNGDELKQIRNERGAMNVKAYEARLKGYIRDEMRQLSDGSSFKVTVITPRAIDWAGGAENLQLYGHDKSWVVQTPHGSKVGMKYFGSRDYKDDGVTIYGGTGKPKKGLFEKAGGDFLNKIIPNELKMAVDPLGLYGSALIDKDFNRQGRGSLAKLVGMRETEFGALQDIGRGVLQGALAVTGPAGLLAATAVEFASAADKSVAYNKSRSKMFEDAAWNSAALVMSAGLGSQAAGLKGVAQRAATGGAISGGITYGRTGDADLAMQGAQRGAFSSVASDAVAGATSSAGFEPTRALSAAQGAAANFATTTAMGGSSGEAKSAALRGAVHSAGSFSDTKKPLTLSATFKETGSFDRPTLFRRESYAPGGAFSFKERRAAAPEYPRHMFGGPDYLKVIASATETQPRTEVVRRGLRDSLAPLGEVYAYPYRQVARGGRAVKQKLFY